MTPGQDMGTIRDAHSPQDYDDARALFEQYAAWLGFDLGFQDFARELDNLSRQYGAPHGCLLLAEVDGDIVGCVGVRRLTDDICEMKRLYVTPDHHGKGLGRMLAEASIERARELGYARMRLDTIRTMAAANALYRALGFREIAPYRHNPVEGALFFELELE
jgi:ribosomal protein S18 acetylase RimI-like enzyme